MENSQQMEINKLNDLKKNLFYKKYLFHVSYRSFEKYFTNIFNKKEINLLNIFTEIAEDSNKYITYNGLFKAYLKYKEKTNINEDLNNFFDILFHKDISGNPKVKNNINIYKNFSQIKIRFPHVNSPIVDNIIKNTNKIEIMILKDDSKIIKGIIIELDEMNNDELFPKKLKYNISIERKNNLYSNNIISPRNDKNCIKIDINNEISTQIFGKNNEIKNPISFLGFKFNSDKLKYIYLSNGEQCSLEEFCKKFSFFKNKSQKDKEENYFINYEKKFEVKKNELNINNSKNDEMLENNHLKNENEIKKEIDTIRNEYKGEINKETKPKIFLRKNNFEDLKGKLSKNIYNDFYNEYHYNSIIPSKILNEIIPEQISERGANSKEEKIKPKIKVAKLNGKEIKVINNFDSDSDKLNINSNHIEQETAINSDASELWQDIGYNLDEIIENNSERQIKKNNSNITNKTPEEKWKYLNKRIKRKFGINLFQTIRRIILAMNAMNKDNFEQYDLKRKIKIYEIINDEDNEKTINIISKFRDMDNNNKKDELIIQKDKKPIEEKNDITNTRVFKMIVEEKNFFIKKIIKINNLKGFLFCYSRKRQAMIEEEDKFNKNLMNIKKRSYKEKEEKRNISKLTTFHGQCDIDEEFDPNFIPDKKSLCPLQDDKINWKLPDKVINSDIFHWEVIKWKKIENMKIFYDDNSLELDNIRQGEYLGDCYFLSALGSLCNINNYLKSLIQVIKNRPNKKIYSIKLNIHGKWKHVLIDNYFPFVSENREKDVFCFGSSFKKELWVSLFEKAWAKINGCYARIGCGGKCYEAFDVLTGAYSELIKIRESGGDTKEILWNKLKDAKDNSYNICAGTRLLGIFENIGLISNHAYNVINIYNIKYEGKNIKLIKVRNPWGEKEFNGAWSDNSFMWNEELKRLVNFEGIRDEGIFYMSFEDFIKYFSLVEILKIKPGYEIISSCKIKKSEAYKCQIIRFEIKEEKKHLFINLYQKNPRIVRKNGTYFPEPVKSFIILAKQTGFNKLSYIKSISDTRVHLGLEATLERGKYYIFCDVNYRFVYEEIYGYNITIYSEPSSYEIKLENITDNFTGKKRAEKLNNIIIDYFEKNEENEKKIMKLQTYKDINFYRSAKFNEDFPFIFFILKNPKEKRGIYFCSKLVYNNKKNVCIYNNPDVSEFDNFIYQEIKEKYTVLLFMGYELSDKFSIQPKFYEMKQSFNHQIFNYENTSEDENFKYYISFIESKKGYVFGFKKTNDKVYEKINFKVIGMNIIDPKYNDGNNNIFFSMSKKGEEKVFNLRLKPDSELFDYFINY